MTLSALGPADEKRHNLDRDASRKRLSCRWEHDARSHAAFGNEGDLPSELRRKAPHNVGAKSLRLDRAWTQPRTVVSDGERIVVCGIQIEPDGNRSSFAIAEAMFYRIGDGL